MNKYTLLKVLLPAILIVSSSGSANRIHELVQNNDAKQLLTYLTEAATQYLLDAEEMSDLVNEPNEVGATPLHFAAMSGNLEVAKYLLFYGADINALWGRDTPINTAFVYRNGLVSDLMLQYYTSCVPRYSAYYSH